MDKSETTGSVCRPPTIGIDASRANKTERTGVEWYAHKLIQELKTVIPVSHRVILYSREPLRDGLENLPPNWESRVLKWSLGRFWTQIRLSWEMRKDPPDLLFVPSHVLPLVLPRTSVMTVHDVGFMAYPKAYGWKDRLFQKLTTSRAAKQATALLTVSEFSKGEITKYFPQAKDKISVTPLAFDPYRFLIQERGEVLSAIGRHRLRQPYFLFVGRLESKKNLEGLIRGFRIFHEKHAGQVGPRQLALVGPRGQGYEEAMRLIADSPASEFIRETGYVNSQDLPQLYDGADALIFPSWYEGFGLPILEAFASRTPVIASRVASLPEVAGEAAEYINPAEPEDIARAMRLVAEDEAFREQLIADGEERLKDFSWKRTAELTWEVLVEKLGRICD